MKINKEILERYESAFGAPVELVKSRCFGKWAGTTDYSLKIGNSILSIGNSSAGQDYLNKEVYRMINVFETFRNRKSEVLEKIESLRATDDELADKMGLQKYTVQDVDYVKSGQFIGWFYVTLDVGGHTVKHLETGLDLMIRRFLTENREFTKKESYHTAGGLADSMVDFVFYCSGFCSKSSMYTVGG